MAALTGALQDRGDVFCKRHSRRVGLRRRNARGRQYARADQARHGHPGRRRPGTPHALRYHDSLRIYTWTYGNVASLRPPFPTVKPFNLLLACVEAPSVAPW